MSPSFDSADVVLGSIMSRMDKSENDINELHSKQREAATRIDQLVLHAEDCKGRIRMLESNHQTTFSSHNTMASKVEMLENKLDDMRSNLTKVIEGQIQILNSNTATREEFHGVLASQSKQHLEKMKRLRFAIYIGGGFLFLASQFYAQHTGTESLVSSVLKFISGPAQ